MSENQLNYPFVLQCKQCNTVIGDSFSLKDYKNGIVVLTALSSTVIVDSKKTLSKSPYDQDCWFYEIKCRCGQEIGKKYITVNDICNGFVGNYCISKEFVYSYGLGMTTTVSETSITAVSEEIDKLQKFCVYLYKKIDNNKI